MCFLNGEPVWRGYLCIVCLAAKNLKGCQESAQTFEVLNRACACVVVSGDTKESCSLSACLDVAPSGVWCLYSSMIAEELECIWSHIGLLFDPPGKDQHPVCVRLLNLLLFLLLFLVFSTCCWKIEFQTQVTSGLCNFKTSLLTNDPLGDPVPWWTRCQQNRVYDLWPSVYKKR